MGLSALRSPMVRDGQDKSRHPDQPASEAPGAYQRATLSGATVTFVTRPQDAPMVYLIGQGKAF
jgi:hypothetical protein